VVELLERLGDSLNVVLGPHGWQGSCNVPRPPERDIVRLREVASKMCDALKNLDDQLGDLDELVLIVDDGASAVTRPSQSDIRITGPESGIGSFNDLKRIEADTASQDSPFVRTTGVFSHACTTPRSGGFLGGSVDSDAMLSSAAGSSSAGVGTSSSSMSAAAYGSSVSTTDGGAPRSSPQVLTPTLGPSDTLTPTLGRLDHRRHQEMAPSTHSLEFDSGNEKNDSRQALELATTATVLIDLMKPNPPHEDLEARSKTLRAQAAELEARTNSRRTELEGIVKQLRSRVEELDVSCGSPQPRVNDHDRVAQSYLPVMSEHSIASRASGMTPRPATQPEGLSQEELDAISEALQPDGEEVEGHPSPASPVTPRATTVGCAASPRIARPPVLADWSAEHVATWAMASALPTEVAAILEERRIDGAGLEALTDDDMGRLGIAKKEWRVQLAFCRQRLKDQSSPMRHCHASAGRTAQARPVDPSTLRGWSRSSDRVAAA